MWHESPIFCTCKPLHASKFSEVSIKDDNVIRTPLGSDAVVFVRLRNVEVEDKEQRSLFKDDHFVFFMRQGHKLVRRLQDSKSRFQSIHGSVKFVQLFESKLVVVKQVPLASAIVVAVVVAFAREVDPLGMAKFVAHEV